MSQQINGEKTTLNWDVIERISKTLSMVAIPIVLAIGGWFIQQRLQNQTLNRDYVQLAVSILKEPQDGKFDPEMRTWAVQLLNDNSPTKFNARVFDQLKSGAAQLPEDFNVSQASPAAATPSNSHGEAIELERKGFEFIINKDVDSALQAFTDAEKLWPTYHNLAEIRKLLAASHDALAKAPKEGKSEAWTTFYTTLRTKYSYGMPADVQRKIDELK